MMTKPTSEQVTFFAAGSGAALRTVQDRLRESVSVKDFGAVGDGIANDTSAFQAAIDSGLEVRVPDGTYLITDSLRIHERTRIIGHGAAAANYAESSVKIAFTPASARDVFVWATPPGSGYVYGVRLEGMTIRGFGAAASTLVNLPNAFGLELLNLCGFAGFANGVIVDNWVDCLVSHCSFQGFTARGIWCKRTITFATTTTFHKCYLSQGPVAVETDYESINSLVLDDCIVESVDTALIQGEGNIVNFDAYLENVPRTDANGEAFRIGVGGPKTSFQKGVFIFSGHVQGYGTALPTTTTFVNADYIGFVAISNSTINRFGQFLKTTSSTRSVTIANVYTDNMDWFGKSGADIYDQSRISIFGFYPRGMKFAGSVLNIDASAIIPLCEFPYFESLNRSASSATLRNKIFNDKATRKLRHTDFNGNVLKMGALSAASSSSTFNGSRLEQGELVVCSTIGAGNPVGFVSQKYSVDVAKTAINCDTTSGSAVITKTGTNPFFAFVVDDWITVSAGMPSATAQYRIIAKASDGSSITLDTNATSTQSGVTIEYPGHSLLPYGQQGYRTSAGSPAGSVTPAFIGEELLDTSGSDWYKAVGATSSNWKKIT